MRRANALLFRRKSNSNFVAGSPRDLASAVRHPIHRQLKLRRHVLCRFHPQPCASVAQIDDRPGILRGPLTVGVNGVELPHFAPPSMDQLVNVENSRRRFARNMDAHNKSQCANKAKVQTTVNSHIDRSFRAQLTFVNALGPNKSVKSKPGFGCEEQEGRFANHRSCRGNRGAGCAEKRNQSDAQSKIQRKCSAINQRAGAPFTDNTEKPLDRPH